MQRASWFRSVAPIVAAAIALCLHASKPNPAVLAAESDTPASAPTTWDRQAAARYMDSREVWWQAWDHDKRDHGTRCVSCHTQVPYALARPALRSALGETSVSPMESAMLADVEKRVRNWKDMLAFYSDEVYGTGKEIESRNAESVLNAIILSSYDRSQGRLGVLTQLAFDHAWGLQSKTGPDAGAWVWQDFEYTPWESKESQYHWAALMAIATATAPDDYASDPATATHLQALTHYLESHYEDQPLLNKVVALWASHWFPEIVSKPQREALLNSIYALERPDGGWSLTDLGTWARRDKTPLETHPDGYATALITLVLEETVAGVPHADPQSKAHIQRGIAWLIANQDQTTGAWPAWSLNKNRDPKSEVGQFMSDAATGYAVLALDHPRK
jgi:squalene-hopene/tetraprenyl-beta-curcumene cyclase